MLCSFANIFPFYHLLLLSVDCYYRIFGIHFFSVKFQFANMEIMFRSIIIIILFCYCFVEFFMNIFNNGYIWIPRYLLIIIIIIIIIIINLIIILSSLIFYNASKENTLLMKSNYYFF